MRFLHLVVIAVLSAKKINCASFQKIDWVSDPEEESVELRQRNTNNAPDQLEFELRAFGEDLKLILFKNDQLAIPQAQVIRRHDGRTVSRENLADQGYYTGYIESKPGSSLAVKVRNGSLSGVIFTPDHEMTIHGSGDGHLITRQKHRNGTLQGVAPSFSKVPHSMRTKRSTSNNRYVELMIVADRYTTEAYGNFTDQYLVSVAYLISAVMQDDSIGDIKVIYTIVNVMVVSGYENGLDIDEHEADGSVKYLDLFSTWVKQFNKADESDPKHFDQAILITKRVCGGQASGCYENGRGYLGDMCSSTRSVATATAAGLSAGLTAAHETGHNFGLSHDSGDCSSGYIMHTALASGKNAFSWSPCSQNKLQAMFSDSKKFSCLNDVPPGLKTSAVVSVSNLAKNYSGDEQCRLMYGDAYGHCGPYKSHCKILYCREGRKSYCHHRSTPPLEGTICGTYKWCQNGECVDQPIPDPIDGQWSSWSSTRTACNRPCGMGVTYRTRTCTNPAPQYFGKDCEGDSKGHYQTCNTQDCAAGTDSFHLEQCKEKDPSYKTFLQADALCLLRCKSGSVVKLYTTTVKDGTLCSKYQDERDICVLGQCRKVACDRSFDRKFYDRCRVCDGDGSKCRLVKGSYSRARIGRGKSAVMFTLPIGAANLLVLEERATYDNIGLKDQNDNWIIAPNSGSSVKYAAGTRITYERSVSLAVDKLIINGRTTEPLKVMYIYWFEGSGSLDYQYYEPLTTPDPSPLTFTWKFTLSGCSETCAGGVITKITTCHRTDDDSEVGLQYCAAAAEPTGTVACNTQACDPSWQADAWSPCSASCGPSGTRTRTVECRRKESAEVTTVLTDDRCTGAKPEASESCNRIDCSPDWVPAEWSACSKNKCEGIQTRSLSCKKLLVTGAFEDRADSDCPSEKPLTELVCNSGVSCFEWRFVYPNCTECQDYFSDPDSDGGGRARGGSRFKPVGCYKMKSKPFGSMLRKLALNTNDKAATVAQCGRVAWERARRVFALGREGECYSSMDAHHVYHRDGSSDDCTDDVIGGRGSVFVYALTGKVLLSTPTCYSVEDDVVSGNSTKCEIVVTKPPPQMKVCCEDMCKDNCYKTTVGTYCSIPFIYKGKMYYECTPNDSGRMWCATTSSYDVDGLGAECEEPCRQRTSSGECCSFPFSYRGRLFNTCTTLGSTHAWCSLTSNYDRDRLKGKCV